MATAIGDINNSKVLP